MGVFGCNVKMYETTYTTKIFNKGKVEAYKDIQRQLADGCDFIAFERYLNKKIKELV